MKTEPTCLPQVGSFFIGVSMNGWVKLHSQIIDNDIWRNDRTAWHVFEYLLLKAYSGKPQGVVVTSRYQIADMVGGNNNTIYKALKRLEKAKMVTSTATSKKTTIRICNWSKYQGNSNQSGNNKVTTEQQQSNTLNKNKDIRVKNNSTNVLVKEQVFDCYQLFIKLFDKNENTYKLTPARKGKLVTRINQCGVEQVKQAIENTANSDFHRGDNDRGWVADFDFIIRSQEQIEKLATMNERNKVKSLKEYT